VRSGHALAACEESPPKLRARRHRREYAPRVLCCCPRVFFSLIGEARAARGRCLVWFAASFNPAKSSHTRHRRGTVLFIIFFFKGPSSLLDRVEYSGSKEWCVYHGVY
jgi:hypothetical protein